MHDDDVRPSTTTRRRPARACASAPCCRTSGRSTSLLGVGGMAAVYAATHRNGKRVAVKMLHAEFSHDEEVRTRFLQEGYAANTIQHDGAVSVLDDDLAPDGSAFLVMELLEGETVEQRWERCRPAAAGRRRPLDRRPAARRARRGARARASCTATSSPRTCSSRKSGAVKVLDFGIAKVFERQQTRQSTTRAGMVMGTPAFMAPEQALAHWEEVDGRTDLWAVGATMFMLLSGQHVHEAQSSQEQLILSATAPGPSLASVAPRRCRGRSSPSSIARSPSTAPGAGPTPPRCRRRRARRARRDRRRWSPGRLRTASVAPLARRVRRSASCAVGGRDADRHDGLDVGRRRVDARSARCASARRPSCAPRSARRRTASRRRRRPRREAQKRLEAGARRAHVARAMVHAPGRDADRGGRGRAQGGAAQPGLGRAAGARRPTRRSAPRSIRRASRSRRSTARPSRPRATWSSTRRRSRRTTRPRCARASCCSASPPVLALALLVAPIVWRATRVVEPASGPLDALELVAIPGRQLRAAASGVVAPYVSRAPRPAAAIARSRPDLGRVLGNSDRALRSRWPRR